MLGERDQDVGVAGADRCGVAVGQVDAAIGQPDVVDDGDQLVAWDGGADHLIDLVAQPGGLLDAGTGAPPQVQLELAAVDLGEEILAQPRQQDGHGEQAGAEEARQEPGTARQAGGEETPVAAAQPLEPPLEALLEAHQRIAARLPGGRRGV
jgi:hypothetical protein